MKLKNGIEHRIEYPRHWWFSCSKFTCYLQTDGDNNITAQSKGAAIEWTGRSAKDFAKNAQRKHGGVMINEYDKDGRWI